MSGEECILAIEGDRTDRALNRVAVDFDAAVGQEQAEPVPIAGEIAQGLAER